ncbi:protein CsuD [Acinetobacter larvae]|uniref:Protein CsuD n=2 Tax=Acinetobacter larvae TaxID=1789224 RepID=A0A1B2M3M1_9GAMM|nr:protein CsuD [Acinetobacter larvae]
MWQQLRCCCLGLLCAVTGLTAVVYAGELPPPPRSEADLNQIFKLYLSLVVNDTATQKIIPVIVKGDDFYIEKKALQQLGIQFDATALLPSTGSNSTVESVNEVDGLSYQDILLLGLSNQVEDWLNLKKMPELKMDYAASQQSLLLELPAAWLPTQMLGRDSWYQAEQAQSSFGLLNNYDFYMTRDENDRYNSNVLLEQRLFSKFGIVKNTGLYTHNQQQYSIDGQKLQQDNGYRRYDTYWQYDHQPSATSWLIGDVISASKNSWGSAIRLGGIQIRRDYGTRPDLITYPLPQFTGQASLPSSVDLIINGQTAQQSHVQSGPFVINSLPFVSGRGDAVIVTTDQLGRQVSTTVPFYVSNNLLKKGLLDYAFSAGKLRENYARRDFDYGQFVSSFDARYGLNNFWTLEGRAEYSRDIQVAGLGSMLRLWNYGILSAAYSLSHVDDKVRHDEVAAQGHQYTVAYQYNRNRFGFSFAHRHRNENFSDLSGLGYNDLISVNSQDTYTAQSYVSTNRSGTFGLGYIQTAVSDYKNKLLNMSWAPLLPSALQGLMVSVSAGHDLMTHQWSAAIQLSIPLFKQNSNLSSGYYKDYSTRSGYINYNRNVPSGGGFGFEISRRFNHEQDDLNQARIRYRNAYFNSDFGLSGIDQDYRYWLGLSGGLLLSKQGLFAANQLGESFSLVDTHGVADVPVYYENSYIGRSNRRGYVFVPSVTPYYSAKYRIDPLDLNSNFNAARTEQRVVAQRGSGIVVDFPIHHSLSANVYLQDQAGQPIAIGALVHRAAQESRYVGMDGIVYLEDLQHHNAISVQQPQGEICHASFDIDVQQAAQEIVVVKGVLCRKEQP